MSTVRVLEIGQAIERVALTREVVVDAAQHHRAAQLLARCRELGAREPVHGDDRRRRGAATSAEGSTSPQNATRRYVVSASCAVPEIEADDVLGLEPVAGLLERLARHGGEQRFALLEMARPVGSGRGCRRRALLDHEELAVALDDRGDRDVDAPCHRPTIFEVAGLRVRFHRRSTASRTC